ncbi:MAG TPA: hypothetical protein VN630_01200, partial [Rhodanobacteraceae bacterium]|nr:hypothetical protein [Rhodanobacteraceae bacterium]
MDSGLRIDGAGCGPGMTIALVYSSRVRESIPVAPTGTASTDDDIHDLAGHHDDLADGLVANRGDHAR